MEESVLRFLLGWQPGDSLGPAPGSSGRAAPPRVANPEAFRAAPAEQARDLGELGACDCDQTGCNAQRQLPAVRGSEAEQRVEERQAMRV